MHIARPTYTAALLLLLAFPLLAQEVRDDNLLHILHADSLVGLSSENIEARKFIGNVRMRQGKVHIKCDQAIQHLNKDLVELEGNVVITQDTLTLKTRRGKYDSKNKLASTIWGIHLDDGNVTLEARTGDYNMDSRIAVFSDSVLVSEPEAAILAQDLVYYRDSSKAIATNSVYITFADETALILADSVIHYIDAKRTYFHKSPRLWQVDTANVERSDSLGAMEDTIRLDTLSITAKYMESIRDSADSFFARDSVETVRTELAARSGTMNYLRSDSLVALRFDPILWYEGSQITGDSIAVQLANNKLHALDVFGNAFSLSASKPTDTDSIGPPGRYDQMSGVNIFMRFKDDAAERIIVDKTAISLYYLYDDRALNGVRRESGDRIIIDFEEGDGRWIRTHSGVEGTYYPERFVTGKETSYNLEGFYLRNDRPVQPPMPAMPHPLERYREQHTP
ncbi:MAG: hypothetical protein CL946_03310 [Ectothiorhodospiraceae bacterium]|nr:hypothetical protein [Ectothiorhodospiraceae bacterium]